MNNKFNEIAKRNLELRENVSSITLESEKELLPKLDELSKILSDAIANIGANYLCEGGCINTSVGIYVRINNHVGSHIKILDQIIKELKAKLE